MGLTGSRLFWIVTPLVGFAATLSAVCLGPHRDFDDEAAASALLPLTSINGLIGDESFVAAFGRLPTDDDDNAARVRAHLAYVERRLREVDVADLTPSLREARRRNLDRLRAYWQAGVFPAGESAAGRQPTFVDDAGRRCAVAALVEAAAGTETIARINGRHRNAYIRQMRDAGLAAWMAGSGFTPDEVAMIQPNCSGFDHLERWQLAWDLQPFYLQHLAGSRIDGADHLPGIHSGVRLIDLKYRWLVGGHTAAGHTLHDRRHYYDLDAHAGYLLQSRESLTAVVTGGIEIEGVKDVVSRVMGVPVGLLITFDTSSWRNYEDSYSGATRAAPVVQLRFGGEWLLRGQREEPPVAWNANVDLVWRRNVKKQERFLPRDLIATVIVKELAGAVYSGIALGVGFWSLDTSLAPTFGRGFNKRLLAPYE